MINETYCIKKAQAGDRKSFDALVEHYYPQILKYCLWHMPNREYAEDAAQETFLKVAQGIKHYAERGKFRAWLYKIAENTCTDTLRQKQSDPLDEKMCYEETGFFAVEENLDFEKLLQFLNEDQREIVLLRYAQDLKLREIGDILELPLRTVQSRLRSALKTLRKIIEEGGNADEWQP